jgi:hypothetical protein
MKYMTKLHESGIFFGTSLTVIRSNYDTVAAKASSGACAFWKKLEWSKSLME